MVVFTAVILYIDVSEPCVAAAFILQRVER